VAGHAVRQLYLLAGAADVYTETGDDTLLTAVVRLWEDMTATRMYLTGGIGAHHKDESFGDQHELPSERAYCETCAAIASVMLAWRLLLITGEARYADLIERTLFNGVLPGVSLDGHGYLYVNPLQVREGSAGPPGDHGVRRKPWFRCACCPPNIMRLLASLQHYLAAASPDGLWLCQYATGTFGAPVAGALARIQVTTGYPWDGRVTVEITATGTIPWRLRLRVPAWCDAARLTVNGEDANTRPAGGWLDITRRWRAGDVVVLELPLVPRLTAAHPRADVLRGCLAIEHGPLVYCLEQEDQSLDARLDDVAIPADPALRAQEQQGLLGGVVTVTATGYLRSPGEPTGPTGPTGPAGQGAGQGAAAGWWPYQPAGIAGQQRWREATLTAVPYFTWGNRSIGAMRIWIPVRPPDPHPESAP
jgi:DUF1680 family protein